MCYIPGQVLTKTYQLEPRAKFNILVLLPAILMPVAFAWAAIVTVFTVDWLRADSRRKKPIIMKRHACIRYPAIVCLWIIFSPG